MFKTKKWAVMCLAFFLLFSCSSQEENLLNHNFDTLMGKNLPSWNRYVHTLEDMENLHLFKQIYEKNIPFLHMKSTMFHVPKIIHFIWIGPKPFPRQSLDHLKSWIAKHPDWTIKFWTDKPVSAPHKSMQVMPIQDLQFMTLSDCYLKCDNDAEKSDLLRYEILYQEGGIYVDHDVKCFQSFEPLCKSFDFYCGIDSPASYLTKSSILPAPHILGARPGHPILKKTMEWLAQEWNRIEEEFPGSDKDSIINRVTNRTLLALALGFRNGVNQESNRDIILPTFYLNGPEDHLSIFSRHLSQGNWFEKETDFEKHVNVQLKKISKKTRKLMLAFGVFSFLNITALTVLWIKYRTRAQIKL